MLANVFAEDVWIIGFLTDEEMQKFELGADKVAVYVPQAYNFAGQLYILPRDKVKKINNISSGEAMKYAVTGGVVDLTDEEKNRVKRTELIIVNIIPHEKNIILYYFLIYFTSMLFAGAFMAIKK